MDRILPIDLERAQLRKSLSGYARKEVDALIKGAAESMQQLLVENDRLRMEMENARSELSRARTQEDTLKDTLVMAQRAADETRATAHKAADALIEEARNTANMERMSAQQELHNLRWEIDKLRMERERFRAEFQTMLERYQRGLVAETLTVIEGTPLEATGS